MVMMTKSRAESTLLVFQLSLRHTHALREPVEPLHDEYEYGREVERLIHRDYRSRERQVEFTIYFSAIDF